MNPDLLLDVIKSNHIKYLILAKLRIYTSVNTGKFVNTIHQYVNFIQLKYPGAFEKILEIGKEETCELVEYVGQ